MRNRKTDFLKVVAIVLFLTGCGSAQTYLTGQLERSATRGETFSMPETEQSETEETEDEHTEEEEPAVCFVHVSGAVREPGVYELPEGSRLYEAVEMAGGFTEEAATAYCNLAGVLEDGAQYHIPTEEEAGSMSGSVGETAGIQAGAYDAEGRLDLNRASKEELMRLTGIGETKAEAILAYREEHGRFDSTEDLKQVSGIGNATFEKLRDDIIVR